MVVEVYQLAVLLIANQSAHRHSQLVNTGQRRGLLCRACRHNESVNHQLGVEALTVSADFLDTGLLVTAIVVA